MEIVLNEELRKIGEEMRKAKGREEREEDSQEMPKLNLEKELQSTMEAGNAENAENSEKEVVVKEEH